MKSLLYPALVAASVASLPSETAAQNPVVTYLSPARNALAVPRNAPVTATFPTLPPATTLRVFSQQAGGHKAGLATVSVAAVAFAPTVPFKAGETVTAVLNAPGYRQLWQFTAAVAPGGGGNFAQGFNFPMSAYPYGTIAANLAVADFNGDGAPDVVVAETGTNPSGLYLNDGQGRLGSRVASLGASSDLPDFPIADVDGDGDLDFAFLRNNGSGQFTAVSNPTPLPAGNPNHNRLLTDVDADGDPDLVYTGRSALFVALNDGTGRFTSPAAGQPSPVTFLGTLSSADLDNDGDLDLVTYDELTPALHVLFNDGTGQFTMRASYPAPSTVQLTPRTVPVLGDLDGDGDVDLVLPSYLNNAVVAVVRHNDGTGQLGQAQNLAHPTTPDMCTGAALGDVDGDGDLDLVLNGATARLYLNQGNGTFGSGHYITPGIESYGGVVPADMNGDSRLDIVAAAPGTHHSPGNSLPGGVSVRFGGTVAAATVAARRPAFQVWPSPVPAGSGSLHLSFPAPVPGAWVELRTSLGQLVYQQAVRGTAVEMPAKRLTPGLYLLSLLTPAGGRSTQRVTVE